MDDGSAAASQAEPADPVWAERTHDGARIPRAWTQLLSVHQRLTSAMDEHLRGEHGLSLREYEVLLMLSWAPGGRMRRVDLAGRLLVTQGGVTRLLRGLEERGLICSERCDEDRRVFWASLTKEGRATFERAAADHAADVRRAVTDRLDDRELAQLAALLGRLAADDRPSS